MAKHGIKIPGLSIRNKTMKKKYPKSFLKATTSSRAKASKLINRYDPSRPVKGLKSLANAADNIEGHLMLYYPDLLDAYHTALIRINTALQSELSTVLGQIELIRQNAVERGAPAPRNTADQLASMFAQLGISH
jgi:hypothetical protein